MLLMNGAQERGGFGLGPLRRTKSAYTARKTSVVAAGSSANVCTSKPGLFYAQQDKSSHQGSAKHSGGGLRSVRSAASVLSGAAKKAAAAKPSLKRLSPSQTKTATRARAASTSSASSVSTTASGAVLVLPKLSGLAEVRRGYRPRRNAVHERLNPALVRTFNVDFHFEDADLADEEEDDDFDFDAEAEAAALEGFEDDLDLDLVSANGSSSANSSSRRLSHFGFESNQDEVEDEAGDNHNAADW